MNATPESPVAAEPALPGITAVADRTNVVVGWLAATALAMIVGGFAPWATVSDIVSVSGTEGDGWFLITAGAVAAGMAVRAAMRQYGFRAALVTAGIGAVASLIALSDIANIEGLGGNILGAGVIDTGWGLYLALLGAVSMTLGGIVLAVRARKRG